MPKAGVIAIFIAILSGLAIGVQSSLNSAAGKMTGAAITGLSAIIAGQMVVALIVDTFGLTGAKPIPMSISRLIGILLLAFATWALLPKK